MCLVEVGHDLATGVGSSAELGQDRKQEVAAVLLILVAKIAIKIGHGPGSCFALFDDILDYCGAS
jgi:hypothetical protein